MKRAKVSNYVKYSFTYMYDFFILFVCENLFQGVKKVSLTILIGYIYIKIGKVTVVKIQIYLPKKINFLQLQKNSIKAKGFKDEMEGYLSGRLYIILQNRNGFGEFFLI